MKETGTNLVGASIKRREDLRLLTGRGCFIDDIKLEKMLIIRFLRSPYAHAKIKKIHIGDAQKIPGIIKVLTGRDIIKGIIVINGHHQYNQEISSNLSFFDCNISFCLVSTYW